MLEKIAVVFGIVVIVIVVGMFYILGTKKLYDWLDDKVNGKDRRR